MRKFPPYYQQRKCEQAKFNLGRGSGSWRHFNIRVQIWYLSGSQNPERKCCQKKVKNVALRANPSPISHFLIISFLWHFHVFLLLPSFCQLCSKSSWFCLNCISSNSDQSRFESTVDFQRRRRKRWDSDLIWFFSFRKIRFMASQEPMHHLSLLETGWNWKKSTGQQRSSLYMDDKYWQIPLNPPLLLFSYVFTLCRREETEVKKDKCSYEFKHICA